MTTPLELATTAATGIVGAMTTQAWTHIRERCVALLHRYLDEQAGTAAMARLDDQRKMLVSTPVGSREAVTGFVGQETTRVLNTVLERSPEAAEPLRSLQEEARSATASGEAVISDIKVENVKAKGDFILGGGHVNVEKSR